MFEKKAERQIHSQPAIISNGINVTYCYTPWVNVLITQRVKMSLGVFTELGREQGERTFFPILIRKG